ncbi:porin [Hyphomicrobium sp.]|uniref:porin n=1 Tax=Hyphomicrobium sp. TaxID=82 RepID=UPI0025C4BC27|nr:porin [Hyphomicrobium sp.]MCC7252559.1 porin [Hyphomicrobium sp.]
MVGEFLGTRTAALAAALIISIGATPSFAADLGGNCCADLEERIAELEATTARKGNRKVSLEVYGQVNEALLFWDDGHESNVYQVTNDNARTRFGFRGKAKIDADWEAGYRIEIGIRSANSKRSNQFNDEGDSNPQDVGLDLRDSYWYLKNKKLGTVSLGQQASSTDQITEINNTQTKDFAKYSDVEDTGFGLFLRSAINGQLAPNTITPVGHPSSAPGDSGLTLRRLIGDGGDQPGEGERRYNLIKYDTPEFAGFTASASWGEDDFWDIALRWAGEFGGFKIAAGIGYGEQSDGHYLDTKTVCAGRVDGSPSPSQKCDQFGGSISVIHEATGLFVNAGAGVKNDDLLKQQNRFSGVAGVDDQQTFWAVQAGIEKKFNSFGKTTIYGEYYDYEGGATQRRTVDANTALDVFRNGNAGAIWGTGVEVFGAGIAQGFDAAALVVYLSYRHVEPELTLREIVGGKASGAIADSPLEDVDLVMTGAIIKF